MTTQTKRLSPQAAATAYLLSCIDADSFDGVTLSTDKDKAVFSHERFTSEYGWRVAQVGEFKAVVDWLQGLALNVHYSNYDAIRLAIEWGRIPVNPNKRQERNAMDTYWQYLAMRLLGLWRKHGLTA